MDLSDAPTVLTQLRSSTSTRCIRTRPREWDRRASSGSCRASVGAM